MKIDSTRGSKDASLPRTVAAEWLVRIQNDDLSVEEISDWQQWLAASDENRKAFEQLQQLWYDFDGLPEKSAPALPPPAPTSKPMWLAIAATVLIAVTLGLWRPWANVTAPTHQETIAYETQPAEHRDVTLQDGSRLALSGKSLALVRFDASERAIKLDRGEVFFDVAKDAQRPFVVRTGDASITAVGTAFNVRQAIDRLNVTVTEGTVQVRRQDSDEIVATLTAGQQFTLDANAGSAKVQTSTPDAASAWRSGRLEYLGEPLKYVVADVNRYSTLDISIADPAVGELLLSGTVFENDIDGWLRSVEALLPVRVDQSTPGKVVLSAR